MEHMTISEAFSRLLAACGAVTIITAAAVAIRRLFNPAFRTRKRVSDLENQNKEQLKCNEETTKLLKVVAETNKLLCKSMIVLLDHSITGNGIDKIKEVKSDLLNYLAEK